MTQTPKSVFTALAESVKNQNVEEMEDAVNDVIRLFGPALSADPEDLREMYTGGAVSGFDRSTVAEMFCTLLSDTEGFDGERFTRHATDAGRGFEYPHTPRRAFVNLAEAIRRLSETDGLQGSVVQALEAGHRVTQAVRELSMPEEDREIVRQAVLASMTLGGSRRDIAVAAAAVLSGREKFDVERFVHHATSDSAIDDDSAEGKWSYNRTHQAEAQKTTIEVVSDDGDGETVVVM